MAVETNRISSSYGLIDHFKNYASRMGISSNADLVSNTTALADEIYRKCGNSYTSSAAQYCPTNSYMTENYNVTVGSGSARKNVRINVSGNYREDNITKLSDISYETTQYTSSSTSITTRGTSPMSYVVSYNRFYPNHSVETTVAFTGTPQFYNYAYSVEYGDIKSVSEQISDGSSKYINIVVQKTNVDNLDKPTSVNVWDIFDTTKSASYVVNFNPQPVSGFYFNIDDVLPDYVVIDSTNPSVYKFNAKLQGAAEMNGSGTPLPKSVSVMLTSSDNRYCSYIDNVFGDNIFKRVNNSSDGFPSWINVPLSYYWGTPTSIFNINSNVNEYYMKLQVFVTNYDGTILASNVKNIHYIYDLTSATTQLGTNTLIWGIENTLNINVQPPKMYASELTIQGNDKDIEYVVNDQQGSSVADNGDMNVSVIPYDFGHTTLTTSFTKYDNIQVSSTNNVNVIYSPYVESEFNAVGLNNTVVTSEDFNYSIIQNNSSAHDYPETFIGGNLIFKIKVVYSIFDAPLEDIIEYIDVDYDPISTKSCKLIYSTNGMLNLQEGSIIYPDDDYGFRISDISIADSSENDITPDNNSEYNLILKAESTLEQTSAIKEYHLKIKVNKDTYMLGTYECISGFNLEVDLS